MTATQPCSDETTLELFTRALAWADWCAGEGYVGDGSLMAPEDFLYAYSNATGDQDWDAFSVRIPVALLARLHAAEQQAENLTSDASIEQIVADLKTVKPHRWKYHGYRTEDGALVKIPFGHLKEALALLASAQAHKARAEEAEALIQEMLDYASPRTNPVYARAKGFLERNARHD